MPIPEYRKRAMLEAIEDWQKEIQWLEDEKERVKLKIKSYKEYLGIVETP